ncbi:MULTISPECIES: 6-carboxytetrahydropterin synthase QueD [Bradyrhizobium]|uniref:6-carboxytetrahydropterin synthase QueD n=1 Tax=Bradyrhizobium TaxID=374 RepID=UPI00164254E2|nr:MULTISPECIES: 6-carboxytetrahydropterin synthase QueD [Bradyrhizobium]
MNRHIEVDKFSSDQASAEPATLSETRVMTRIGRTYRFEAAHHLPKVPDGHKCKNMHGHNYRIEVVLSGKLDERGFVADFAEMDADVFPLIRQVDHRVLNDVPGLENPTAEVIAAWFLARIANCESVRVYENDDCWAEISSPAR